MHDDERELLLALAEAVSEIVVAVGAGVSDELLERIGELSARLWRRQAASE